MRRSLPWDDPPIPDPAPCIWLARPDPPPPAPRRLAVKDNFDTAGLVTTYGSALYADHLPERTAPAVGRLLDDGWKLAGKTNMHEFAYGVTSENPHFGAVPNPRHPGRIAGGSSGGSAAALAAGEADGALGSDTGGSIRIPAACCGVVGFKPTYGLVAIEGCFPLAPSFDTAGPLGPDVETATTMTQALVPGFERAGEIALADLRIGVAWAQEADPEVASSAERAAAAAGAKPVEFPRPEGQYDWLAMPIREAAEVHRERFAEQPEAYGADLAERLRAGLTIDDASYERATQALARYRESCSLEQMGLDLLITPTLPFVPPPTGRTEVDGLPIYVVTTLFTRPFSGLGCPALALPCGLTAEGLPVSVQLIGPPGADALVLAAGAALERTLG